MIRRIYVLPLKPGLTEAETEEFVTAFRDTGEHIPGLLDSFAAGHFQGYSELVTFLVFTVIIMVRPTGIFGERTVNRA